MSRFPQSPFLVALLNNDAHELAVLTHESKGSDASCTHILDIIIASSDEDMDWQAFRVGFTTASARTAYMELLYVVQTRRGCEVASTFVIEFEYALNGGPATFEDLGAVTKDVVVRLSARTQRYLTPFGTAMTIPSFGASSLYVLNLKRMTIGHVNPNTVYSMSYYSEPHYTFNFRVFTRKADKDEFQFMGVWGVMSGLIEDLFYCVLWGVRMYNASPPHSITVDAIHPLKLATYKKIGTYTWDTLVSHARYPPHVRRSGRHKTVCRLPSPADIWGTMVD